MERTLHPQQSDESKVLSDRQIINILINEPIETLLESIPWTRAFLGLSESLRPEDTAPCILINELIKALLERVAWTEALSGPS